MLFNDHTTRNRGLAFAASCAVLTCLASGVTAVEPASTFRIHVELPGAYRVSFEALSEAGLDGGGCESAGLGLVSGSNPVPIWVEDGGDGLFGPGDWIEFIGEHLSGEVSYLNEYSRYNVYFLRLDTPEPARMRAHQPGKVTAKRDDKTLLRTEHHFEKDKIILRFPPAADGEQEELWYWSKLAYTARRPFVQTLDLSDLDRGPGKSVDLKIALRGWSGPRDRRGGGRQEPEEGSVAHHRVDVALNGVEIGSARWNGTRPHVLELSDIAADQFAQGENTLELRVPKRKTGENGKALVDVVMLNWIEIAYDRGRSLGLEQSRIWLRADGESRTVHLRWPPGADVLLYGSGGSRTVLSDGRDGRETTIFFAPPGEFSFIAASHASLKTPVLITRDHPSDLAEPDNRADYIMIAHSSLLDAVQPLADFHRSRGLDVEVVDVQDVYDEFNAGVVHPRALRSFLAHAYHRWQPPEPHFVLLVGDASWDGKNPRTNEHNYPDWTFLPGEAQFFVKNTSTKYAEGARLNQRNLIPSWNHATHQGHAASDNWFVCVSGDDGLPDMAIGRFPVAKPEEVAQIVKKTIRYAQVGEVGPWRRKLLVITSDARSYQIQSDRVARTASVRGLAPTRIYPKPGEKSNRRNTGRVIESFDGGQLLVHFLGHGGSYIWRTGAHDRNKNHDLFTLDHLDQLQPTHRLPVVLSLTCYSAPFDHPSADSIGEKLLRIGEKGAVAVLAASWRNSPLPQWGQVLLEELTTRGTTVGEAVLRAKTRIGHTDFVETYNLLGDPATRLALPQATIGVTSADQKGRHFSVAGEIGIVDFRGNLIVELVDDAGEVVKSVTRDIDTPDFVVDLPCSRRKRATVSMVRVYAWNTRLGIDAAGVLELSEDDDTS